MPKKIGKLNTQILTGAARYQDLFYVAVTDAELVREDVAHSFFLGNDNGIWGECGRANWKCVGMTIVRHPEERMLAISEDGDVFTYVGGKATTDVIMPRPIVLRGVSTVEGKAVAFGMRRQVYVREDKGRWKPTHGPDIAEGETAGFEGLCGFSLTDLYAVGWEGEIWYFDGRGWRREDSPVDIILTGAVTHTDGHVYVCGQNGTLLRGRAGLWEVIADGDTVDDFWTIASFNEQIYVASFSALYVLVDDHLKVVDLGDIVCNTFRVLSPAQGVLWSIGAEDVIATDGRQWAKIL